MRPPQFSQLNAAIRQRPKVAARSRLLLFKKFHRVTNSQDGLGSIIGNLAAEFFLKGHHKFYGIEAVGTKIINEARFIIDLFGFDPEMFDHDFFHPFGNIAHISYPSRVY